jgi:hypothetical protein
MVRLPIALLVLACVLSASPPRAQAAPKAAARAAAKPAAWKPAVPFIEDDFGGALALAKERKLPVFIEGWAPW